MCICTKIGHGSVAATLLDSVMGRSLHTTLKAGAAYTTLEIKVNYVRAMTDKTGPFGSRQGDRSRLAHRQRRLYLAHGITTCLLFPI
jgi:hypothetical protein